MQAVRSIDWHFPEVRKSIDFWLKTNTTLRAAASSAAENPGLGHVTFVTSRQDHWPARLSNDLNKIQSKVVWQISFKACRASVLQVVAVKWWHGVFFPCFFFFLNEARKRQWQVAMTRWDPATKKWEPKHHDVLCSKHFEKNASQIAPCWAFSLGSNTCPQGNRLWKISSSKLQGWSSDTIASSWAFVYFPLVIPSFSSLVWCVAFRSFSLCLL